MKHVNMPKGRLENPLLVSVRSGARASMPGMMDTILNLGLNEEVVEVIAKQSNNPRWAWHAGAAVVAHVAEGHGLHVDGGAPGAGDVVHAAVDNGSSICSRPATASAPPPPP